MRALALGLGILIWPVVVLADPGQAAPRNRRFRHDLAGTGGAQHLARPRDRMIQHLAAVLGERVDAFVQRIKAVLAKPEGEAWNRAVAALFHHAPEDEAWAAEFAPRVIRHIVKLQGWRISFQPLSPEFETVHIVDGWKYRPNLDVLGQVVFTNLEKLGNDTRAPYGRDSLSGELRFPLTTRGLVVPNAPPDKQLQILTIGMHFPSLTYTGWCDIRLSDNLTKRLVP